MFEIFTEAPDDKKMMTLSKSSRAIIGKKVALL